MLQVFFHESSLPKPPKITLGSFPTFLKIFIFISEGAPPVSMTPAANLPPVSTAPAANLPPVSTAPAANLPPVSTAPAANFATGTVPLVLLIPVANNGNHI